MHKSVTQLETNLADALTHGGRLIEARQRWPDAPAPFIDLSTGVNPTAYPFRPPPQSTFARLPEPEEERTLRTAAAAAYGIADPAMVVPAPGSQALIRLLPRLYPPGTVSVLGPTYAEHAAAWADAGHRVEPAVLGEGAAWAAVVCNPNNPDGRRLPLDDLLGLAARVKLLVVDEAFADFDGPSLAPRLPVDGVIVLRSFGKPYGLAGLRLGFALAAPATAAALRAALGPWPVSGPAIAIGRQALGDAAWRVAMASRLGSDAERLDAMLTAAGLRIVGGTRLFRLAESDRAQAVAEALGRAGILVRRFVENPRLLRFGLPGQEHEWRRLAIALGPHPAPFPEGKAERSA